MSNFESHLNQAIRACRGEYFEERRKEFFELYPFTTENISGYIDNFDLKNKSLLTVGSSADQCINASLHGCLDQTVYDISPFTKYYFYLKKIAMLNLSYKEFLDFFAYRDYILTKYPGTNIVSHSTNNTGILSQEKFNEFSQQLRLEDYESYLFWSDLIQNFPSEKIRKSLFKIDENRMEVTKEMNAYLHNEDNYNKTKTTIKYLNPYFINENLYNLKLNRTYDNIFLSNVACYCEDIETFKTFIDALSKYLNINGKMLMAYLYRTNKNTKYDKSWQWIYELKKVYNVFSEYNLEMHSFIGTHGILWEDKKDYDSILVYEKKKQF